MLKCIETGGDVCDSTAEDPGCDDITSCASAPADLKNTCVDTFTCNRMTDGIKTLCTPKPPKTVYCDITLLDDKCKEGFKCQIAPDDAKKGTCIATAKCGQNGIKCSDLSKKCDSGQPVSGCGDGFSCATAPKDWKDKCIPEKVCGT